MNYSENRLTDSNSEKIVEDRDSESDDDDDSEATPPPLPPRISRGQETINSPDSLDTVKTLEEAFIGENCGLNDSTKHNGDSRIEKMVETADRER